jgi:hypothetical protein
MSRDELVRLVDEAEADAVIRRSLRHCRFQEELILAAQCINVPITEAMAERMTAERIVDERELNSRAH